MRGVLSSNLAAQVANYNRSSEERMAFSFEIVVPAQPTEARWCVFPGLLPGQFL